MADLYDMSKACVGLNQGQQEALKALKKFSEYSNPARYFVLRGYAGTGKTFLMNRFCDVVPRNCIYMTATTNKAAKVLRFKVPVECTTIYSLLGLRISDEDEQPQLLPPENSDKRRRLRGAIVVVDECSMITLELLGHIKMFAVNYECKFVFVGDPAQLPPVEKEEEVSKEYSPVWELGSNENCSSYTLSEIVRYDGPIEKVAGYLRELVLDTPDTDKYISISSDVREDKSGVYRIGSLKMDAWINDAASRGMLLDDDNKVIILAFTNKQVEYYNNMVRSKMFPNGGSMTPYYVGERIVMTSAFSKGEGKDRQMIARNRDEFRIVELNECDVSVSHDHGEITYRMFMLECITPDTNELITLPVLHPADKEKFEGTLTFLAKFAKDQKESWQKKKAWKDFWQHKGCVAHVAYAYAMTTHCSQGSTYEIAFVDMSNIMGVKRAPLKTRLQSLYVAVTRASRMVITN